MAAPRAVLTQTVLVGTLLAFGVPALAQDEPALKSALEGRRVTIRMDMPGSADGVDVRGGSIDLNRYRNDLKRYGTAIHSGESAMVTLIKVKKDLIELQLDGGGFGTFGDDTSTSVNLPDIDKSDREKTLEKEIKDEKNPDRKRTMQSELDRLRSRRESENRLIRAERQREEAIKRDRIAQDRLRGGSRFNIRYTDRVPATVRAEDIMTALAEYVDFKGGAAPAPMRSSSSEPAPDLTRLRKGMLRADAERLLGRPNQTAEKTAGGFTIVTLVFVTGEQRITADFVEDVLVRYSVSSR